MIQHYIGRQLVRTRSRAKTKKPRKRLILRHLRGLFESG